jgi:Zn-dependent peptidase ImmA (M78 family)
MFNSETVNSVIIGVTCIEYTWSKQFSYIIQNMPSHVTALNQDLFHELGHGLKGPLTSSTLDKN